jgi:hypothetical protein
MPYAVDPSYPTPDYLGIPMGSYRTLMGTGGVLLSFGAFSVAVAALTVGMFSAGGPPVGLVLTFWFIFGWCAYWWLLRISCSLTLRDGGLEWEAPLRRGRVATTDLTAFRPMSLYPGVVVIEHRGGQSLLVRSGCGINEFAAAVREVRPDLDVSVGRSARLFNTRLGPSNWYPDT